MRQDAKPAFILVRSRIAFIGLSLILILFTTNAFAETITFIHSGTGSGTLGSTSFTDRSFTIAGVGDTSNRQNAAVFFIDLDSATIDIAGVGTATFITPTRYFVSNSNSAVGFSRAGSSGLDLYNGPVNSAFSTWDMLTSIGPISGTGLLLQWTSTPITTNLGTLVFNNGSTAATFRASVGPTPPSPPVPVVLVHGWCGSPGEGTWDKMLSLLQAEKLSVDYANYSTNTERDLKKLAGHLKNEIRRVLNNPVLNPSAATQVDIVAHSMGGLVARALISGMATDGHGIVIPYENEVRRLITIATPHYGTSIESLEAGLVVGFVGCSAPRRVRIGQASDMEFGSEFIWQLHHKWLNTDFSGITKSNLLTIVGTGLDPEDKSDFVVFVASAALPDLEVRARYVDRYHFGSIASIDDENHETFKLVKAFLLASNLTSPAADACDIPTCRRDLGSAAPGLILARLLDDQGNSIDLRRLSARADTDPFFGLVLDDENPGASNVTLFNIPPNEYAITFRVLTSVLLQLRYGPKTVSGVNVNPARPTVLGEVRLDRVRNR